MSSPRGEGLTWFSVGTVLSLVLTWPLIGRLGTDVPGDAGDPLSQAWILSWNGHALLHQPLHLFDSNTFFPAKPSLAFGDALIGYAPAGLIGGGGTTAALVRYNLLFIGAFALAFAGAALLARELGVGRLAAAVAGSAYAYAPWRIGQDGHLNVLSEGGVPLSLYLLLGGYRDRRPRRIVAGWLVAAWQVSLGFGLGIWFCYLLLVLALAWLVGWLVAGRPGIERVLIVPSLVGMGLFGAVTVLMAVPFLVVQHDFPQVARNLGDLQLFSPPPRGLLTTGDASWLWGGATHILRSTLTWPPEEALFPGIAIVVLALRGLRWPGASRGLRSGLFVGLVVTVVLSLGIYVAGGFFYLPLYHHLPGWDGLRTPGRLAFIWSLILALLGAFGAQGLREGTADWLREDGHRAWARSWRHLPTAVAAALIVVVLVESLQILPVVPAPLPTRDLAASIVSPTFELPSDPGNDITYMFWSTDGFPQIGNGNSSYTPPVLTELRTVMASFPDPASIARLRQLGFKSVVLHPERAGGTVWQDTAGKAVDGLGITRADKGDLVVYDLRAG